MKGLYQLNCQVAPYFLRGNFDNDLIEDVAILIKEYKKDEAKTGIIIGSPNNEEVEPVIFGAGQEAFEMDDFSWLGIFEKVDKESTIEPNWNEETDDFYHEGDVIPEDEIVKLQTDAIFLHVAEACGGGFIYWKDGKYNWMQNE